MNFKMTNLKWIAVLAIAAGCVTTEEKPADEAAKPVEKTPSAVPVDPFKAEYEKHLKTSRKWTMHSQPSEILKAMPPVLAFIEEEVKKGGHEKEINALMSDALGCYRQAGDYKTGVSIANRLYANETLGYYTRLPAAQYLAIGAVDAKRDYAAADAYYAKLATLKPQNPFMKPDIAKARADLYVLRNDKAGALAFLEGERAKVPERDAFARELYDDKIAEVYGAFFDYAGKLAFWQKRGNKRKIFKLLDAGEVMNRELRDRTARGLVADDKELGVRREAWMSLWKHDAAFCEANLRRVLGTSVAETNAFCNALAKQVGGCAWNKDWEGVVRSWDLYRRIGRTVGNVPSFDCAQYAAIGCAAAHDKAKAAEAARAGLENQKLKPEERYQLSLMAEMLGLAGDEKAMLSKLSEIEPRFGEGLPFKDRKSRFERAGGLGYLSCDDALARACAAYYRQHMDPVLPRKTYTVKFSERPVGGAGDWANMPFKPEESPFDRKFGGANMDFMTTDVATGDRGNAVQGGAKAREFPTTLQVVADEWGIHFLYTFYDARARQFASGELDAGSFESYIAAGENRPYSCFLCQLRKRAQIDVMNTTYDMPGHRRIDAANRQHVRSETVFTDDAAMQYTGFSWDCFADHVPADGNTWDFESVFWGPVQAAWNGTKSIHGRSTWGQLRFELGEAARIRILRDQLFRAVGLYRNEKSPKGAGVGAAQPGVFDRWADDVFGDPEFYERSLKPLVAELDEAAARVNFAMTDDDVKELSEKYLSRFLNVRYEVARRHRDYMKEKL